jgi:hypothetical protein
MALLLANRYSAVEYLWSAERLISTSARVFYRFSPWEAMAVTALSFSWQSLIFWRELSLNISSLSPWV